MENKQSQKIGGLLWKSMALSFILHIILLQLFTFTFSPMTESYKPKMVFLGAILKKHDIECSSMVKKNITNSKSLIRKLYNHTKIVPAPYEKEKNQKPLQENIVDKNRKITMKSIFDTSYKPRKKSQEIINIDKLQKYFRDEKYIPLSLPLNE